MAKIDVNAEYSEEMEEIVCEPARPQIFNERFRKLLNNDSYLREQMESNKYTHPNSGVTTGTYKSVTVNAQGHVISGSNPTTLAGFGITNTVPVVISTSTPSDTTALWIS